MSMTNISHRMTHSKKRRIEIYRQRESVELSKLCSHIDEVNGLRFVHSWSTLFDSPSLSGLGTRLWIRMSEETKTAKQTERQKMRVNLDTRTMVIGMVLTISIVVTIFYVISYWR